MSTLCLILVVSISATARQTIRPNPVLNRRGVHTRGAHANGSTLTCPQSAAGAPQQPRYVVFFGTRPETIKMAPILQLLSETHDASFKAVFTGQHPDLVAPFAKFWRIAIDVHVTGVFRAGQSLAKLTASLIYGIDRAIKRCPGDIWLVQGDTTSAFAAGYVAFLRGTPVIHVEAGLRTFDMRSPFPEEWNRRVIGMMATLHAAPTKLSRENLIGQGVSPSSIVVTGNTGLDAARLAQPHIVRPDGLPDSDRLVFVTMHRRENRDRMAQFFAALAAAPACQTAHMVIPVHPNPAATKAALAACEANANFHCVEPLNYGQSQWMLKHAMFALTDSGGLQEEATWYSTPTLVLRASTERPEAVHAGTSMLTFDPDVLRSALAELCKPVGAPSALRDQMRRKALPFGDGYAAQQIMKAANGRPDLLVSQGQANATHPMRPVHKLLPRMCGGDSVEKWSECSVPDTVTVVLTVFARDTLKRQLAEVGNQTIRPHSVLVVQSRSHVNGNLSVAEHIAEFRAAHPEIPIQWVDLGANGWYHSRFFLAHALSDAEYVAIVDDDEVLRPKCIATFIQISRAHNGSLVTENARNFKSIQVGNRRDPDAVHVHQGFWCGPSVDFGGHIWVLPRDHLRHYFAEPQFTRKSAEDVQLSFALQKHGISTTCGGTEHANEMQQSKTVKTSSYMSQPLQVVRNLAFCQLMQAGFKPRNCKNCTPENIRKCITYFQSQVKRLPEFTEETSHIF
jgi:UDP-N-acetylglucosamine 2-epimerase (non-hydrolysing)